MNEAFPHGPNYGCSITHYRRRARSFAIGAGVIGALFVLGMLLGAANAQAQTIIHISERDGYVIVLGDAPCPTDRSKLVARFDSTKADASTAQGCWGTSGESVVFVWPGASVSVALPVVLPAADFLKGRK